jgi:hypothetical protein
MLISYHYFKVIALRYSTTEKYRLSEQDATLMLGTIKK